MYNMVTPFSDHRISDQKVRTVIVRVTIRVGDTVVRNAVGRKVGNRTIYIIHCDMYAINCTLHTVH